MSSNDSMESMLRRLRYQATAERRERTLQDICDAMDAPQESVPALSRVQIGRIIMKTRMTRFALAAAVILVALGGVTFWPFTNGGKSQWWLAPSAAWGQEILAALDTVGAVTCREQTVYVGLDGAQDVSTTWDRFYMSQDSYRRDIYDGQVLREIQWYVPDGNDMLQHYVRYDQRRYGTLRHKGSFEVQDPIARIRSVVGQLEKAGRVLGEAVLDGHDCVLCEIRAGRYAGKLEIWGGRIWLDTRTKLPVRIEQADRPITDETTVTTLEVMDQFNFDALLPADTFIFPGPPKGFVNAHPDDLPRQQ